MAASAGNASTSAAAAGNEGGETGSTAAKMQLDGESAATSSATELELDAADVDGAAGGAGVAGKVHAAARFVPLRLDAHERTYLRLLEASVFVSDYVDKVCCVVFELCLS